MSANKGFDYERNIARMFSMWWTGRDDCLWRSQSSGARATTRRKKGKETYGQYGDIAATAPEGDSFVRRFAVEIKRGYNTTSPLDLLDNLRTNGLFRQWVIKTHDIKNAEGWMIVFKRDRREAMVMLEVLPRELEAFEKIVEERSVNVVVFHGSIFDDRKARYVLRLTDLLTYFPSNLFRS